MIFRLSLLSASLGVLLAFMVQPAVAQEAAVSAQHLSPQFVPGDAIAVVVASPAELLSDPRMEMFPIEVVRAQSKQQIGVDPLEVQRLKLVVGMPGPRGPGFGLVLEFTRDYAVSDLPERLRGTAAPQQVDGLALYSLNLGPGSPPLALIQHDARTWLIGPHAYVPMMAKADQGQGPLPQLMPKVPQQPGVTAVVVIEPVRPMLVALTNQQAGRLPEELRGLQRVPELVDALMLRGDVAGVTAGGVQLVALCRDEAAAEELEKLINEGVAYARETMLAEVRKNVRQDDPVSQATLEYAQRIAGKLTAALTPQQSGKRVRISLESDMNVASAGVMVGLLLPAVQAAREASRRMTASNNLKQIMLSMHNYHDTHQHFPEPAIRSADGKPLLSWRVALLPFLEQQTLYQQFHLDEPWDSAHNLSLLEKMPPVYVDPSAPLPPGETVFHAVVGEEIGLKPEGKTRFADFTDGTSNSVLVAEVGVASAVPWTKPADVAIDLDQPLANMGTSHAGGFHVALADGAVKFIAKSIDPQMWRALLTRAGGEATPR